MLMKYFADKLGSTHLHINAIALKQGDVRTNQIKKLTDYEKQGPFEKERNSWVGAQAFERVSKTNISSPANLIGSLVIYKSSPDDTPKSKIAPWGAEDAEKDEVRGDSPTINLDSMRLLFSLAAEHS